mmetsp:Transcript_129910/g.363601  ORF Transcript_129910/g.363601 Transcript_129910/m.363601 type:complete len:203 (-) Transcript_129910:292-900(-)
MTEHLRFFDFFSVRSTISWANGSKSARASSRARVSNSSRMRVHSSSNRCCISVSLSFNVSASSFIFWRSSSSMPAISRCKSWRTSDSIRCRRSRRISSKRTAWISPARCMMPCWYAGASCRSKIAWTSASARCLRRSARTRSSSSSASAGSEFSTKAMRSTGLGPSFWSMAPKGTLASACSFSHGSLNSTSFARRPACVITM